MAAERRNQSLAVCLSGGGYRATCFSAGALLAVLRSSVGIQLHAVCAVSGGSVTAALFAGATGDEADLKRRVRTVGGLVTTDQIGAQSSVRQLRYFIYAALALFVIAVGVLRDNQSGWAELLRLSALFGIALLVVGAVFTVWDSACAVQSVMEVLIDSEPSGSSDGFTVVYCATDLGSGDQVYLRNDELLTPGHTYRLQDVAVSDRVAASAGFPGLRPIILGPKQVAELPSGPVAAGTVTRAIVGTLALFGVVGAIGLTVARAIGLLPGQAGLITWAVGALVGLGVFFVLAHPLRAQAGGIYLVDGGIVDNLGPAFTFLAGDARYPDLPGWMFGAVPTDPALADRTLLVVDASKPVQAGYFTRRLSWLETVIPLRFRVAVRSGVQLVATSNAQARHRAIAKLITITPGVGGGIVGTDDAPTALSADPTGRAELVASSRAVPTTLDPLDPATAASLIRHGYLAMADQLVELGLPGPPAADPAYFAAFTGPDARTEIGRAVKTNPVGPFGRRRRRLRRAGFIVFTLIGLGYLWLAAAPIVRTWFS